jgi:hypothetical protein
LKILFYVVLYCSHSLVRIFGDLGMRKSGWSYPVFLWMDTWSKNEFECCYFWFSVDPGSKKIHLCNNLVAPILFYQPVWCLFTLRMLLFRSPQNIFSFESDIIFKFGSQFVISSIFENNGNEVDRCRVRFAFQL